MMPALTILTAAAADVIEITTDTRSTENCLHHTVCHIMNL